ncbi:MAG: 50S ribosomal protein L10 [Chloroflexi bacterium RBG_16_56_11]|nr:MAG: 50S ribosomal protein L10 [Chloroflexi bacterium RBG_16_56_11]
MATEKKVKIVEKLQETFSKSRVGIITDYRGLTTSELNEIRRKLREARVEYRVVKNSLARMAAKNAGLEHAAATFTGPVAVALGYGEEPPVARILTDYIRTSKSTLTIKGGFLPGRTLSPKDVEALAKLPSRERLLVQVLTRMKSPVYGLVYVLAGPLRGLTGVLQARIKQMEGA